MRPRDGGTTSPALLNRLGDWRDHRAWSEFIERYDPLIRSACRSYRLDAEVADELCQRIWIELARRSRTFHYDPGKTFRGWLGRLCHSRAIDLLRERKADPARPLDHDPAFPPRPDVDEDDGAIEDEHLLFLRKAEEVQDAVRRRVDERTWRVFWEIAVEGGTVRETSEAQGMSYAAAFAAQKRVGRMLREEGRRLLSDRASHAPE